MTVIMDRGVPRTIHTESAWGQVHGTLVLLQHQAGTVPSSIPKEKNMVAQWEITRVSWKLIVCYSLKWGSFGKLFMTERNKVLSCLR